MLSVSSCVNAPVMVGVRHRRHREHERVGHGQDGAADDLADRDGDRAGAELARGRRQGERPITPRTLGQRQLIVRQQGRVARAHDGRLERGVDIADVEVDRERHAFRGGVVGNVLDHRIGLDGADVRGLGEVGVSAVAEPVEGGAALIGEQVVGHQGRVVAAINRRAAGQGRVRQRRAAVVLERTKHRIAVQEVMAVVEGEAAVIEEVVAVGHRGVAGNDRVFELDQRDVIDPAAQVAGLVVGDGDVEQAQRAAVTIEDAAAGAVGAVAADGGVGDVQEAFVGDGPAGNLREVVGEQRVGHHQEPEVHDRRALGGAVGVPEGEAGDHGVAGHVDHYQLIDAAAVEDHGLVIGPNDVDGGVDRDGRGQGDDGRPGPAMSS